MTSLLTSLTRNNPGSGQLPFVETYSIRIGGGLAVWPSANLAIFARFRLAAPMPVNTAQIFVGTAAGNVDIAVGTIAPATGVFTLLASTGATAAAGSSALQAIALAGGAVTLPAGVDLVYGMAASSTSLTVQRLSGMPASASALGQMFSKSGATIPLASQTLTLGGSSSGYCPWIWLGYV